MHLCVTMFIFCADDHEGQRWQIHLELEFQAIVIYVTWILRRYFESLTRAILIGIISFCIIILILPWWNMSVFLPLPFVLFMFDKIHQGNPLGLLKMFNSEYDYQKHILLLELSLLPDGWPALFRMLYISPTLLMFWTQCEKILLQSYSL